MFKIAGLDHIVLNTDKLADMLHFYCNILNCTIENTQPEFNLTQLRIGSNIIDLIEIPKQENPLFENLNHFCLRIIPFNYEELRKYFEKNNIETYRFGYRYGAQGYGDSFYLRDPENNEVELTALV